MDKQLESVQNKVVLRVIDDERQDQRLDNYLINYLKGVPRSRIYRLIRKGEVRVNKKRAKAQYRLQAGDQVRIPPVRRASETVNKPLAKQYLLNLLEESILFEDSGLIIINKPAGMAVHGGSGINIGVIEAFRQLRGQERMLELVHRLDRDTSGCLMIAKKNSVLRELHQLLREHRIEKTYHALLQRTWQGDKRRVMAPLRKNTLQSGERIVRIDPQGKEAVTDFKRLQKYPLGTLVEAKPKTGRTHQIRVHAAFLGHAVVGDDKYADAQYDRHFSGMKGGKRLMLHAASLSFILPSQQRKIQVVAPTDQQWSRLLRIAARDDE